MSINSYFDEVYMLNLRKRPDRLELAEKRMKFCGINYSVFGATDGSVMKKLWECYYEQVPHFSNPSYLGCAVSHLSMYRDALSRGYKRILIVEDDNRIHRMANSLFQSQALQIPEWKDLLYLGYIPLSDDCSRWDYSINAANFISSNAFVAKNLWGLYGYGITAELMEETLQIYEQSFPMELDRFFVSYIQPRNQSFGVTPQIFAADDGPSDNSGRVEVMMLQRSIDSRFASVADYV